MAIWISKKKIILACSIVLLGVVLFVATNKTDKNQSNAPTYIVISHNDAHKNGGALTILNTDTLAVQKPDIPNIGCNGVVQNPAATNTLLIYCLGSNDSENIWDIDLNTFHGSFNTAVKNISEKLAVPTQARVIRDSKGRLYFTSGVMKGLDRMFENETGVVIIENNEASYVSISNTFLPFYVMRMVVDEELGKLWIMSSGNGKIVLIDRVDLASKKIDLTHIIESYSGFDMVLHHDSLVVSTSRTSTGKDISVIDRETGKITHEITLPVSDSAGFNALGLLSRENDILVGATGGMYVLENEAADIDTFIENNPGGRFTFFARDGGDIYAIDSYDKIYRIKESDLSRSELLLDATGTGLMNVYVVNTGT